MDGSALECLDGTDLFVEDASGLGEGKVGDVPYGPALFLVGGVENLRGTVAITQLKQKKKMQAQARNDCTRPHANGALISRTSSADFPSTRPNIEPFVPMVPAEDTDEAHALLLAILCSPAVFWLRDHRVPTVAAVLLVVLVLVADGRELLEEVRS